MPRRGDFAAWTFQQLSEADRELLAQELPKWGLLIVTNNPARAAELRGNDPGVSELASYGMDVRVVDSICMVQRRYSPFENREVLAQVDMLGTLASDLRPQGAVQSYGLACSVSHLRACVEAECRYGGWPSIVMEDDQSFITNARTYLPQVCLFLLKTNLWRAAVLMYLGRGQHSADINQRVFALPVIARLGAMKLRQLQPDKSGQVPWIGEGARIMLHTHPARVLILGNITRQMIAIDVHIANTLARNPRALVLTPDPPLSSPDADPDTSLALRGSRRLAHDFPRRPSDVWLVKFLDLGSEDKFFMLQILRCIVCMAGRGMIAASADNAMMLNKMIRQPQDLEGFKFPNNFVGDLWLDFHHMTWKHLSSPSLMAGLCGEIRMR